ncbi:unnamed protein product [Paramecium octaurelia]|uniref:Uncharacterized protein n=1 Tax=Paramecium octaurelia TaxID=43137 RepID=A0A8S1T6Z2_PAROT|nr:unnamed protein product [Paramecium octaurelia]
MLQKGGVVVNGRIYDYIILRVFKDIKKIIVSCLSCEKYLKVYYLKDSSRCNCLIFKSQAQSYTLQVFVLFKRQYSGIQFTYICINIVSSTM